MSKNKEMKLTTFFRIMCVLVLAIYSFFLYLFYPAKIIWEPFVAAAVYTFIISLFIFIISLSPRIILSMSFLGYLMFLGIAYYLDSDMGTCLTADFCLSSRTVGPTPTLFLLPILIVIQFVDFIFLHIVGFRFAFYMIIKYPSARYYTMAGLSFFFLILMRSVYLVLDYEASLLQNIFSVHLGLLGLVGIFIALNLEKLSERVKKIPAALMVSTLFLLPLLAPFKEEDAADAKLAIVFFVAVAVFVFFFLMLHKKQKIV